jgi:hypothetical protein
MTFIGRSPTGTILLAAAASVYAIGMGFLAAAYIALTPTNLPMVSDLSHGSDWLRLIGSLIVLVAVIAAGRSAHRDGQGVRDPIVAAFAALLIAVGLLVEAAAGETLTAAGVIVGLGIAVASLPVFARDDRAIGTGLVLFAIGYAMFTSATSTVVAVTAGLFETAGVVAITFAVATLVHPGGYLRSAPGKPIWVRSLMAGLFLLIIAFIVQACVTGVIYSGHGSLADARGGFAAAYALQFLGFAMLGISAWAWYMHLEGRSIVL